MTIISLWMSKARMKVQRSMEDFNFSIGPFRIIIIKRKKVRKKGGREGGKRELLEPSTLPLNKATVLQFIWTE